ncbi:MAG TPA: thymidine phosphorylase [Verrucomicrobiota bacterium]|nr:thymidine phosphorylase [Verrucomicrobiota bacterium]HNT13689.1 thymidine phosphorylase [Verrucomicrobiota bacterium]
MNFLRLIERKRDGQTLADDAIRALVRAFTTGNLPAYQMAALLMAVYFRGLNREETTALTLAMRDSGETLQFPPDPRPLVDKHSTGGIGDKVSLPLTPLLICLGFRVPMISGRGLGITGGTLDKLDSIPGFQTLLSTKRIQKIVQRTGGVICGQTERMVPADKKIYALRDVTGTVPNLSLITASILSKKLAENLDALILDVKFGTAAFMPTLAAARQLARAMVSLGRQCGVRTRAVLTDMNTPLGRAAGNWLEVKESLTCLEGQGPADLRTLVLTCAAHLLVQTGRAANLAVARRQATACLDSGAPRRTWDAMLRAQGADLKAWHRKLAQPAAAPTVCPLKAPQGGWIARCDARIIGEVVRDLGGGRQTQEAAINHAVGIDQMAKPGEWVERGGVLCRVHAADGQSAEAALAQLPAAFQLTAHPVKPARLIWGSVR